MCLKNAHDYILLDKYLCVSNSEHTLHPFLTYYLSQWSIVFRSSGLAHSWLSPDKYGSEYREESGDELLKLLHTV